MSTVRGGCSNETRGQASADRSVMEGQRITNRPDYAAYSATIHCPEFTDNCSNHDNVKPRLGKYKS